MGIVVLNQVTDVMDDASANDTLATSLASAAAPAACHVYSGGRLVRPALGLSWDHCVTTRLMIAVPRSHKGGDASGADLTSQVMFTPPPTCELQGTSHHDGDGTPAAVASQLVQLTPSGPNSRRTLHLLRSPVAPLAQLQMAITELGVVGIAMAQE